MTNIGELFASYQTEAFRLELLPQYIVTGGEWENFSSYKETAIIKRHEGLIKYLQDGKTQALQGKRHIRARVIPDPITEYFVFETKAAYIPQAINGFENVFLEIEEYKTLLQKLNIEIAIMGDFWLFDKSIVALMEYDSNGKYLSQTITEDKDIVTRCISIRDEFIFASHSLSYLLDKLQLDKKQGVI